jgi:hypothetical protein
VSPESVKAVPRQFTEATVDQLIDLYKNRTSIQGDALAAIHISKWIRIKGIVRDASSSGGNRTFVQLKTDNDNWISAGFNGDQGARAMHLAHGLEVTIVGQIRSIDTLRVSLEDCELT